MLKILPFGAIHNIRKLRLNRKKRKSKNTRKEWKQHGPTITNLVTVPLTKHQLKPKMNFVLAMITIHLLKNKELQVSELLNNHSIDAY